MNRPVILPRRPVLPGIILLLFLQQGRAEQRAQAAVERVNVDLVLVDVEARDARGHPMRGLKAADFEVRLNGVRRALYSVDDHCGCDESTPAAPAPVAGRIPAGTRERGAPVADPLTREEPFQVILYFDFALMDLDGRSLAFNEARRWIRETMRDGDQVMIVGSTFSRGALTVAEMTGDRTRLLAALDAMKENRDFVDPYMGFLHVRIEECKRDWSDPATLNSWPNCNINAFDEYTHTRGTLKTLGRFLESLDPIEGRKHLVLLHQIAIFRPADVFPGTRQKSTHQRGVEEVSAAAVASRVAIHAAAMDEAGQLASMAAEYTGGTVNRGRADLSRMLDDVRNRCECLYRLGIEPLEKESGRIGEVTVRIRNRFAANMRVKSYSPADQWLRKARRALRTPGGARDLPVHAVLLPVAASNNGWTARVQVALLASALTRLPGSLGSDSEWEAGALLELDGGTRTWEMLAVSSMKAASGTTAPDWFVHEKTLTDLPPGSYRLSAFVRDRAVDLFGGASSDLVLPEPGAVGVIGPIPLLAGRRMMITDLPLQPVARDAASRATTRAAGLVPAGESLAGEKGGAPFEILTWLCGAAAPPAPPPAAERFIGFEDTVVMKFPVEAEWTTAGACLRLTDRIEAGLLDHWPYRYHLKWKGPAGRESIAVEAALP